MRVRVRVRVRVCVCVCVCVRERQRKRGGTYTVMSPVGNSTLKKTIAIFAGAKTITCTGKSFHTFRVTKQTFIPTYIRQKILSCNQLDNSGENASKIC